MQVFDAFLACGYRVAQGHYLRRVGFFLRFAGYYGINLVRVYSPLPFAHSLCFFAQLVVLRFGSMCILLFLCHQALIIGLYLPYVFLRFLVLGLVLFLQAIVLLREISLLLLNVLFRFFQRIRSILYQCLAFQYSTVCKCLLQLCRCFESILLRQGHRVSFIEFISPVGHIHSTFLLCQLTDLCQLGVLIAHLTYRIELLHRAVTCFKYL